MIKQSKFRVSVSVWLIDEGPPQSYDITVESIDAVNALRKIQELIGLFFYEIGEVKKLKTYTYKDKVLK